MIASRVATRRSGGKYAVSGIGIIDDSPSAGHRPGATGRAIGLGKGDSTAAFAGVLGGDSRLHATYVNSCRGRANGSTPDIGGSGVGITALRTISYIGCIDQGDGSFLQGLYNGYPPNYRVGNLPR